MSKYYCEQHKYNPQENSGIALCPECEIGSMKEDDTQVIENEMEVTVKAPETEDDAIGIGKQLATMWCQQLDDSAVLLTQGRDESFYPLIWLSFMCTCHGIFMGVHGEHALLRLLDTARENASREKVH